MSILLFVDENPPQHIPHVRLLAAAGHTVMTCEQTGRVLESARRHVPDLVLLAWREDSTSLCRQAHEQTAVPIIVLTAPCAAGQRELIMDSGAERYVIEPCAPSELVAHVRNALSRSARTPAPRVLRAGDLELDLGAQ